MEMTEHGRDEGLDRKRVTSHMGPRICHTYRQTEGKITRETHNKCRKIETVSSGKATQHVKHAFDVNMHILKIMCRDTVNDTSRENHKPVETIAVETNTHYWLIHLSRHLKLDRTLVAKVVAEMFLRRTS